MSDVELARDEIGRPQVAQPGLPQFEIDVEVSGWTERVAVRSPARPGEVRGAVEKVLRDMGMPASSVGGAGGV